MVLFASSEAMVRLDEFTRLSYELFVMELKVFTTDMLTELFETFALALLTI